MVKEMHICMYLDVKNMQILYDMIMQIMIYADMHMQIHWCNIFWVSPTLIPSLHISFFNFLVANAQTPVWTNDSAHNKSGQR